MKSDFEPSEYVTVPNGWSCKRLADCTIDGNISYGIVQPGQHVENGIPVIRINNVNNGQLDLTDVLKVSPEIEKKYERTRLKGGEVLLTLVGSTGQSFVAPKELAGWNVPRAIAVIRANADVGADWLNICLQSKETLHFLNVRANTTVQKTLNLKDVRDIPILIPPKGVKESIQGMTLSLSKKIELNRQTNLTLEQIAQALFKSWFVDFEPTRAKIAAKQNGQDPQRAAMAAISGKTVAELDDLSPAQQTQLYTTAALFPDALVDSELGEIPEGWELGELRKIAHFATERIDGSELTLKNYISTENMLEGKKGISTASSLPEAKTVPRFEPGQILISNIRPYFKKIWLASFVGGRSNDVLGINANESESVQYLYNLLYQDCFFNFMMTTSKGAKMPRGDKEAIMGWACVQPALDVREAYSKAVEQFSEVIVNNNKENQTLERIRDTLLPKLLSGELSVNHPETALEQA